MLISNCESIRGERSLRLSLNVTSLFGVQYCSCIVIYEGKLTVRPDKELFGSWRSRYVDLDFHFELTPPNRQCDPVGLPLGDRLFKTRPDNGLEQQGPIRPLLRLFCLTWLR